MLQENTAQWEKEKKKLQEALVQYAQRLKMAQTENQRLAELLAKANEDNQRLQIERESGEPGGEGKEAIAQALVEATLAAKNILETAREKAETILNEAQSSVAEINRLYACLPQEIEAARKGIDSLFYQIDRQVELLMHMSSDLPV